MLNLTKSSFNSIKERNIKDTNVISQEGLCLIMQLDSNGEEVVLASPGTGTFTGFSYNCQLTPAEIPKVETFTVPDTVVDADRYAQLARTTIVKIGANNHKIHIEETDGTEYTEAGAIADKQYVCSDTGKITFHANQNGKSIIVVYKYSPTVMEIQSTEWYRGVNINSAALFERIGVGKPPCVIYTSEFNPKLDWGAATGIKMAASGQLEDQTGGGTTIVGARVIHVPDVNDAFLGIEIL